MINRDWAVINCDWAVINCDWAVLNTGLTFDPVYWATSIFSMTM